MQPNIVGGSYGRDKYTRDVTILAVQQIKCWSFVRFSFSSQLKYPNGIHEWFTETFSGLKKNLLNLTPSLPPESPL